MYRPTAFIHAWGHFTTILPLKNESNCFRIQEEQQLPFAGASLLGKNSTAPPAAISIQILTCKLPLERDCTYCCHFAIFELSCHSFLYICLAWDYYCDRIHALGHLGLQFGWSQTWLFNQPIALTIEMFSGNNNCSLWSSISTFTIINIKYSRLMKYCSRIFRTRRHLHQCTCKWL